MRRSPRYVDVYINSVRVGGVVDLDSIYVSFSLRAEDPEAIYPPSEVRLLYVDAVDVSYTYSIYVADKTYWREVWTDPTDNHILEQLISQRQVVTRLRSHTPKAVLA